MTFSVQSLTDRLGARVCRLNASNEWLLEYPDGKTERLSAEEMRERLIAIESERKYVAPPPYKSWLQRKMTAVLSPWKQVGPGIWSRRVGAVEETRHADGQVEQRSREDWEPKTIDVTGRCRYCGRPVSAPIATNCAGCGAPPP